MRFACLLLSALAATAASAAKPQKRDYSSHDFYAVHLRRGIDPEAVARHLGLTYDGKLGELEDHYIFRDGVKRHEHDEISIQIEDLQRRRRKRDTAALEPHVLDDLLFSQKQELHKRFPLVKRRVSPDAGASNANIQKGMDIAKGLDIKDPIFGDQWHLYNPVQSGHDINVTGVWAQGITGKNSTTCIVDDGLDLDSLDLKANYFADGSYDFNDKVDDPKPRLSDDRHGTRCAGEVAAVRNDICGVGVAYDGRIAGLRILSKVISDADEAEAMNYAFDQTQIYSCSWGPPDDGQSMEAPGILIKKAMVNGVQKGRQGHGSIYVFAIGNGAANDDNCNFDGYTNSIYSVSVGGIDRKGLHPYYSEKCSAQLVVTYSSGSGDAIHTTDVGEDVCYSNHGGTSAAGPLVAGIYALMLEANPELTWRDIQWITVLNAVKVDNADADYQHNSAIDRDFSHQYGYGKADAWRFVEAAKNWQSKKPQAWFFSPWQHVRHKIPEGDQGLTSHFTVTKEMLGKANLETLEHVTVTMNVEHTRRGDLSVDLLSPSGLVSHIATHRRGDNSPRGYEDWAFMSVAHWGESGIGEWTVIVKDTLINEHNGTFVDWRLKLFGESIDPESQKLLPLPTYHDDDDHDREDAIVSTTSVSVPTETGSPEGNPSGHPDRPQISKTQEPSSAQATPTPSPSGIADGEEEKPSPAEDEVAQPTSSNFLPHPFPTFGASKRTQVWIYGAIVLILIFLISLLAYFLYVRRKRRWMNRDKYNFEVVPDQDEDNIPLAANARGGAELGPIRGNGRKKRAGELYDAFAEGSDDEHAFGLGSDSEGEDGYGSDEGGRMLRGEKQHDGAGRYRDSDEGPAHEKREL
ncbi:hypothetical protein K431DRAFT_271760 [Polychaeton citri CBS 116435]|uniref:P/Homo B domain-containing protein n=1 Tax=Polychaeton citri CBS 116435 TaxID=1314669 RepID=A0A9P4Q5M3_9PEZI|nr:hypothetical protein K431DRAFT_271760 [Polychaeton citri CBS 116435]